jgi:hypothetical protein
MRLRMVRGLPIPFPTSSFLIQCNKLIGSRLLLHEVVRAKDESRKYRFNRVNIED